MSEIATLKIWRGLDANAGWWETYEVPFEAGQSVLDGLRWNTGQSRSGSGNPLLLHKCQCLQGVHGANLMAKLSMLALLACRHAK